MFRNYDINGFKMIMVKGCLRPFCMPHLIIVLRALSWPRPSKLLLLPWMPFVCSRELSMKFR